MAWHVFKCASVRVHSCLQTNLVISRGQQAATAGTGDGCKDSSGRATATGSSRNCHKLGVGSRIALQVAARLADTNLMMWANREHTCLDAECVN